GTFELLATFEPVRIRAVHPSGIAEVLRQPDEEIGTLRLQPWATIAGQLVQDGEPIAEQLVIYWPAPDRGLGEARFQDSYQTQTDKDGRFAFNHVPPGLGSVRAYLGPWQDSPLTSSESVSLNLEPGEQKEIALGGSGITVTGTVNATGRGDVELNKNWSLNYLIRRDAPHQLPDDVAALSFDPSGPVESAWFLDSKVYSWLATRTHYFVKLTPDGEFRIHGVPPGTYDLVLRLYEQPSGCLVETIGEKVVPIEVTAADVAAGTLEAGAIDVACRAGPRIGENMQAYKFVDVTGRERTIHDMQGQSVLLHVWASWCAPCIAHMPKIQASIADWTDRPITVVGLNIDEDRSLAQSLVDRNRWNWAQMYL
ncbi:MAG: TlpA disulfide reductase family protein, partial [Pirellulales bacterium]